jgi:leucyl-tRNA synthetase
VQVIEDAESIGWADADGDGPDDVERSHVDRWLLSKLQETVETVTEAMEDYETRTASQAAFHGFEEHLRWYRRRADLDRPGATATLAEVLETRLRLLAPFVPFLANDLHERLTGGPAEDAPWPEPDSDLKRPRTELEEERIEALAEDVADIVDVTGVDPETIRIYVAAGWKREVFEVVAETGTDVGQVMGQAMQREALREQGDAVNQLVQELVEFARGRDEEELRTLTEVDEAAVYEHAQPFLEREFDATVLVEREDADPVDPADRAGDAEPFRPAIYVE